MTLRDEVRQFMVACEVILDRSVNVDELNHVELELLEYYVCKVSQKIRRAGPGSIHSGNEGD